VGVIPCCQDGWDRKAHFRFASKADVRSLRKIGGDGLKGDQVLQYQEYCCFGGHASSNSGNPLHAKHERKNLNLLAANIGHIV